MHLQIYFWTSQISNKNYEVFPIFRVLENYSKLTATINALKEQNGAYLKESSLY